MSDDRATEHLDELARLRAERDQLAEQLGEAQQEAEAGWKAAEGGHKDCEEWAATCKRLMAQTEALQLALNAARRFPAYESPKCGAVTIAASGVLGPCVNGWHHESFPHQDVSGARWLSVVLPADAPDDNLPRRLEAAYRARFDGDGHPEDAGVAAEVAMSVIRPELDRRRAGDDR